MSGWEPKIVSFLCNWCSYGAADLAGVSRMEYPPNIRGHPYSLYRPHEPQVYSGLSAAGSGWGLGVRVTSRRLPLPGR